MKASSEKWRFLNRYFPQSWLRAEAPGEVRLLDRTGIIFLIAGALWYLVTYLRCPSVPGAPGEGWWAWWDQSQFYQCASDLSHGELKPTTYWFGYSLLGAPFCRVMPAHPFFIPDLALTLTMLGAFFASCRTVVGRLEAWILVVLLIFVVPPMRDSLLVPSNTIPAYAATALSAYLLLFRTPRLRDFALCAVLIWITLFGRPSEIFPLALLYGAGITALPDWPRRWLAASFFVLAVLLAAGISLALNFHFYGQWSSPYAAGELGKFHLANYGLVAYQLFFDGTFLTGSHPLPGLHVKSIGETYPVTLFCLLPGLIYLIKRGGAKFWGLPLSIAATIGFYLTYSTLGHIPYFWAYGSCHYIWWVFPWVGMFSYLSFRYAFAHLSRSLYFTALLTPWLLALSISFRAVPLADSASPESHLNPVTTYEGDVYTVRMICPAPLEVTDVRLDFQTPPSYSGQGTSVVMYERYEVRIKQRNQVIMLNYYPTQTDSTFDFSFLVNPLHLQAGDSIEIKFKRTEKPVLTRVSLIGVEFKLGRFSK